MSSSLAKFLAMTAAAFCCLYAASCEYRYPEVIVVNELGDMVEIKDVSFNGCIWPGVLKNGKATQPARCLPGEARVHFKKFDAASYCEWLKEKGKLESDCDCGEIEELEAEEELSDAGEEWDIISSYSPMWFNYQTAKLIKAEYGGYYIFEIKPDEIEQDFEAPSPYGH